MRILIVDDDRSACRIVAKILSDHADMIDLANDGPSALELVRQNHYDLVILDYKMPLMNGVELYGHIHKIRPDVVGIFLTAFTRLDTIYPAINAGISRVLAKPVNPHELLATVKELSNGRLSDD